MDNNEMINEVMENTEDGTDLVFIDQGSEGLSTTAKVGLVGLGVAGVAALAVATKKPRQKAKRWIARKLNSWSGKVLAEPVETPKEEVEGFIDDVVFVDDEEAK